MSQLQSEHDKDAAALRNMDVEIAELRANLSRAKEAHARAATEAKEREHHLVLLAKSSQVLCGNRSGHSVVDTAHTPIVAIAKLTQRWPRRDACPVTCTFRPSTGLFREDS